MFNFSFQKTKINKKINKTTDKYFINYELYI